MTRYPFGKYNKQNILMLAIPEKHIDLLYTVRSHRDASMI